jgi:hypothetical protein
MRGVIKWLILMEWLLVPAQCLPAATGPNLTWVEEEDCNRETSRHVRAFIHHSIYPQLGVKPEELPKSCPLHPDNYVYADQESQKQVESRMDWKCNICGKHFKTEFYVDKHMHNAHPDHLRDGAGSGIMCPARLCPIFGCRETANHPGNSAKGSGGGAKLQKRATSSGKMSMKKVAEEKNFDLEGTCTDASVERSKYQCEVLIRRCFGHLEKELYHFQRQICNALHCHEGLLMGSIYDYEKRVGSTGGNGAIGSSSGSYGYEYQGGSGSSDPRSAYRQDDDDGMFTRKVLLVLILLGLFSYLTVYVFCGEAFGRNAKDRVFWRGGAKSSAAKGMKGDFRAKGGVKDGPLSGAMQFLRSAGRKRHDS